MTEPEEASSPAAKRVDVRSRRQPGTLLGKIRMSRDFDTLPPDVLATFESDEV